LELCVASLQDYCRGKYKDPRLIDGLSLLDMAEGLEHIHSNQLVHRDIKPQNILIAIKSRPLLKISDFGLCKETSQNGTFSMSGVKGTTFYLAPEILKIDESAARTHHSRGTDVFAMGCTFFRYLTRGIHPFGLPYKITYNIVDGNSDLSSKFYCSYYLSLIN
jgi:serine/threonine protein kinase